MIDVIRREISRALAALRMPVRAIKTGGISSNRVQRVHGEALKGERLQDMELIQQFGLSTCPPDGSQLIIIPVGGRSSAAVVVATEHGSYRFKVDAQGEAALYNQWGDVIHLKQDRSIRIVAQAKVRLETPLAEMTGNLSVAGNITSGGNMTSAANITAAGSVADQGGAKTMAGMRSVFNAHTQIVSSGVAQPPGGGM